MLSARPIATEGVGTVATVLAVVGFAAAEVAASMLGRIVAEALALVTMRSSDTIASLTIGSETKT